MNHPNIITVYEIGNYEGQAFIAMEYVEGESLREKINSPRIYKSAQISANRYNYQINVNEIKEINEELINWIKQAYKIRRS